jgi:hypothetical protein
MKILNFLVESFIGAFGITRPKPEQKQLIAVLLGGFLLFAIVALAILLLWMLFGGHR